MIVARQATAYLATHQQLTFSLITRYEVLRGLKARRATLQLARFEEQCTQSEILGLTCDDKFFNIGILTNVSSRCIDKVNTLHGRRKYI